MHRVSAVRLHVHIRDYIGVPWYLCKRIGMLKYLPGYYVPGHAAARASRLHLQHRIMYHDARRALRTGAHFVVRALVRLPRAGENAKAQPRASVRFACVLQKTGPVHLPRSQSGPGSAESLSQQGRSIAGGPSQRRSNVPPCLKCLPVLHACTFCSVNLCAVHTNAPG